MPVSAATRVAAVIGDPVAHSRSPDLHNAAFAAAGIDAVYVAWRVTPADLSAAVAGFRALSLLGASVTVPHKQSIASLCDRLAAPADTIGAVNCLVFERAGEGGGKAAGAGVRVIGHNTDAGGFVDSLRRDAGLDPAGCRAVLLGAGGAARAVHAGLHAAGADRVEVIARRPDAVSWTQAQAWTPDALDAVLAGCDVLVDCTSLGLDAAREAQIPAPVPVARLSDRAVVASLVYHREPALLRAARARGLRVVDGAGMLVYQGARAFELWTGRPAPLDAMWTAMRAAATAG